MWFRMVGGGSTGAAWLVAVVIFLAPAVRAAESNPTLARIERTLRTGGYEQALRAAEALARKKGHKTSVAASLLAARAERRLGRLANARARLEQATVRAPDDLALRTELMEVAHAVGDRGAVQTLASLTLDDRDAGRIDDKDPRALVAWAQALRRLGQFEQANRAFRQAASAPSTDVTALAAANVAWGDLFLDKHAADQATTSFREALTRLSDNPDARVGLARALIDESYDAAGAERELAAALAIDPRHARAWALRGELALDAEDLAEVDRVLVTLRKTNPHDEQAAWLAASRALLTGDRTTYERERDARLTVHPRDGAFFSRVAEALVRHRRYDEARAVAHEGVALDGRHASSLSSLGTTLLRLGEEAEGLTMLRRAFALDPYDVRTFNVLELFDKVIPSRYEALDTAHFHLRFERGRRAAVEEVIAPFLEETYARYVRRYGVEPPGRIVVEMYADPAHFAVRTVGLPRLGVTAVCFGRVITSQAPVGGTFSWGMVLAHELAHTFALELTRYRVPRWLTEGLAEAETAALNPSWRRHEELALAAALDGGGLLPLRALSHAFVRARDAEAAGLAYAHSAALAEFLEHRFGFPAVRKTLVALSRGERTEAALAAATGMPIADIDRAFREHLGARLERLRAQFLPAHQARFGGDTDAASDARRAALQGLRALGRNDLRAATLALVAARRAGGDDEPATTFLAGELALLTGDPVTAQRELRALVTGDRDGYDVRLRLGLAALAQGQHEQAEAEFRRAVDFAPEAAEARTVLAELLGSRGRREDRAIVEETIFRLEPQNGALGVRVLQAAAAAQRHDVVAELAPLAIFIDPADGRLHAWLGEAVLALGRRDEARAAFERALRLGGVNEPAGLHRHLAQLHAERGHLDAAAAHRAAAQRLDPVSAPSGRPAPPAKAPSPAGPTQRRP